MRKLLAILILVLAACGGDSTGPAFTALDGTFELQTVAGDSLPVILVQIEQDKQELTAASIDFAPDGTLAFTATTRETVRGAVRFETGTDIGTYSGTAEALTLRFEGGTNATGSVEGDTFTMTLNGIDFLFRKAA